MSAVQIETSTSATFSRRPIAAPFGCDRTDQCDSTQSPAQFSSAIAGLFG